MIASLLARVAPWTFLTGTILASTLALPPAQAADAPDLPTQLTALAPGLSARVLIAAGEDLADGSTFPPKNDLTAFFPTGAGEGFLIVGHEIRWGKDAYGGRLSRLKLKDGRVVGSQLWSSGMHNNCAGGVTPWKTLLTCEEYPHDALPGESTVLKERYHTQRIAPGDPAASFGWVYEVNPFGETPAGKAVRRTALGRCSHESTEMHGESEVYLTEDFEGGFLFKFVAARPRDLSAGNLFAYDRKGVRWARVRDPYNAHIDAKQAGATPFNRLEDLKLGPDGQLYLAETGVARWKDPYGRVLRLDLRTNRMSVAIAGDGKRLANPDNLLFDRAGRLLICEDQSNDNLDKFGNNEVLRLERTGQLTSLITMSKEAEPTGPSFSPDGKSLFLSAMAGEDSAVLVISGL